MPCRLLIKRLYSENNSCGVFEPERRVELKLAGADLRCWDGQLLPLSPEREDSGIDSDDNRPVRVDYGQSSEGSSSDEEPVCKTPWVGIVKRKPENIVEEMEDEDDPELMVAVLPWQESRCARDRKDSAYNTRLLDRSSPPLYEVELTASDEDDDESVLELVIPMQTSRYQRVPTSSPKKAKSTAPTFLCNLFCCLRK